MIRSIGSSDERFRTVTFSNSFNLLLAEKKSHSEQTDTRNSVGKSSLVELIHFLLGASADKNSLFAGKALRDHTFFMVLDWPETDGLVVSRRGAEPGFVTIARVEDDLPAEFGTRMPLADWQLKLEETLFNLRGDHPGISGRAMLSFLARRIGSNAYNEATRFYPRQSAADGTSNLAYLLGLDWALAARYKDLQQREKVRRSLRDMAREPLVGRIVGKASDLRGQITIRERRVNELQDQIDAFTVVPEFEHVQGRADELASLTMESRQTDSADRRNLRDIETALREIGDPIDPRLDAALSELQNLLVDDARRRYEDVSRFHESVIRNRERYLHREIQATRARLVEREGQRVVWGRELSQLLQQLKAGGALDSLMSLQKIYSGEMASLESLRGRYEAARALEASGAEIILAKNELRSSISEDLEDRAERVDEATLLFNEYASTLYRGSREPYLGISAGTSSLEITPHIDTDVGRGVGNMVIFCFDLTVAVLAHRANRGPDFLIHDSHLFDGVDARQIGLAMELAVKVAKRENLQYIMSLNSDDLDKALLTVSPESGRSMSNAVISPVLSDEDATRGLFGFRF